MIGVEGQYVIKFSVAEEEDFLTEGDLTQFLLEEQAGNILPKFSMVFRLHKPKLLEKFNKGNSVRLSIGKEKIRMFDISLLILGKNQTETGEGEWIVGLKGILDNLEYIQNPKISNSGQISGVESIIKTASNHFNIDTNINSSSDTQNWLQMNISDSRFIDESWLHCYLPDSFLGLGITALGKFKIRDMVQSAKNPNYFFLPYLDPYTSNISSVMAMYKGMIQRRESSGFYNSLTGYQRKRHYNTLETSEMSLLEVENEPILANVSNFNRKKGIKGRAETWNLQTDNMHENYWKAYDQNVSYLSMFSAVNVQFSVWHKFINIGILDTVYFDDAHEKKHKGENYTGYYFIDKIVRQVDNKFFRTNFSLCRENLGNTRGDLY